MQKILTAVEETAKLIKLAVIESDEESLRSESVRLLALGFVLSDIAEMRSDAEEPSNNNNNKNNGPKARHGNTRLPYGLCKREGIDTTGMSPKEAWEALAGRGISAREEYKKLKDKSSPKVDIASARASRSTKRTEFKKRMTSISSSMNGAEHRLRNAKLMAGHSESVINDAKRKYGIESKEDAEKMAKTFRDEYEKMKAERDELWRKGNDPSVPTEKQFEYRDEYYRLEGEGEKLFRKMRDAERASLEYDNYTKGQEDIRKAQDEFDKARSDFDTFWKEEKESNEEYYKAIRQQFPTIDSCQTPTDVSEYMLATGAFDGIDKPKSAVERRFYKTVGYTREESEPIDLSQCDMETAKGLARVNDMMLQKVPAFKECLSGVESSGSGCSSGTYACCYTSTNEICLNPKYFGNSQSFAESFKGTQEDNYDEDGNYLGKGGSGVYSFHPKGLSIDSVYAHESCHALGNWITYKLTGENPNRVRAVNHFENEVIKAVGKKFKTTKKDAWKKISRYAKKNEAEFFAESMSLYLCGDGSNEVANFVGEYTINKLKEMGYDR